MSNILNELVEDTKNYIKKTYKYMRFIIVILLFLLSSIFKLIPIQIFHITENNITPFIKIALELFSNGVLILLLILLFYKDLKRDFIKLKKMKKEKLLITLDTCFRYWLIGLVIMIVSNFLINKLGISSSTNDVNVRNMLDASPILAGISVILLSPFIEEIVFRMSFKDIIKNKWLFIMISGCIFGGLHVVSSITNGYEALYLIPYCSLGIAFGLIYYYCDNIYILYFIHLIHNLLVLFVTFLLAGVVLW